MEKTDQLAAIVRRWAQIKKRWDDKKADFIEREYIEPLSACTAAIMADWLKGLWFRAQ